tara:strand:+ start:758 stop:1519 length:762 start_codon:yes stop_codon:yes gene_type:complete
MKKHKILALIPARMGSSRFPGKPMAPLLGTPMIGHVYKRVSSCSAVDMTAVATCDKEIAEYIESLGGIAIMTKNTHERASDRCAEALQILIESSKNTAYDIVVMVQGDEPMIEPDMIVEAVTPIMSDPNIDVVNLGGTIETEEEFNDLNCIKLVRDKSGNAIYFSRRPIPNSIFADAAPKMKQVCVIPFRTQFLFDYTRMEPTPLEIAESIDMLRILEHGKKVYIAPTIYQTKAVDTLEDLKVVEEMMRQLQI